jgi:hypothetical protein
MKTLLVLFLTLSLLFVISCYNTPEKKIIHDIENRGFIKIKILGVNIVDTIYKFQVVDTLMSDLNKLDSLNKWMKKLEKSKIDSLRKLYRKYDRIYEFTNNRIKRLSEINYNVNDNAISGYYVLLRTKRDTFEIAVKKDFKMLAPRFMLEFHDRPKREFRPRNSKN